VNEHRLRPMTVLVMTADALVLTSFMPDWEVLARDLSTPRAWLSRVGVDAAAITVTSALLWLAACWMALGLLALLASVMPGRVGRVGARISRCALPVAVRRIVVGAAGLALTFGPVPALAEGVTSPSTTNASPSVVAPAIGWPTDLASPSQARTITPLPATAPVSWPSTVRAVTSTATTQAPVPSTEPDAPPQTPGPENRPSSSLPPPAQPQAAVITVKPGESLWLIAAHRLGNMATDAEIAAEWPQWYAANRTIVGDDPALLRPGQQLTCPPALTVEDH
jgi:hypothetical protein